VQKGQRLQPIKVNSLDEMTFKGPHNIYEPATALPTQAGRPVFLILHDGNCSDLPESIFPAEAHSTFQQTLQALSEDINALSPDPNGLCGVYRK
jgi:hypothetical protein